MTYAPPGTAYDPDWILTQATVTTCRFQSPGLGTLAFGFSTRQRFRITFDYYAHGRLYSDEFQSPSAIPQNQRIPLAYNPLQPEQNSRTHGFTSSPGPTRSPLIGIAIAGSIILSLLWLALLRACS